MKQNGFLTLEPSEGYWLTENTTEDLDARTFSKEVINAQYGAWTEWTDEQKTEWEEAHKQEDEEQVEESVDS